MTNHLTEEFVSRIAGAFGQPGAEWLAGLPSLLEKAGDRWEIDILPPFGELSYNYVAPAIGSNGEPVVLKPGVPRRELSTEIDALRHFDGHGAVRLIDADANVGLLLLERLDPREPLQRTQDDDRATSIFSQVMRRLIKPAPETHSFPNVSDWARGFARLRDRFDGKTGPFPEPVVARAEALMSELLGSTTDVVVLHGDLHHWNILSAEREPWLALDPKGVIGEPEYEVGAWLRNPYPQILDAPRPQALMSRRLDRLVEELEFDRDRMLGWAYSQAVLSAIWSYEEESDEWERGLACADWFVV